MDPLVPDKDSNLDRGISFTEGVNLASTPTNPARRLSAAGRAAKLKERNLIPPLNSPTDRRVSLPRATKVATPPTNPPRKTLKSPVMPAAKPAPEASVLDEIKNMIKGVRTDIASSEDRMASKFDELSVKLTARIDKTEAEISSLAVQVSRTKAEIETARKKVEEQDNRLPAMIEQIVAQKLQTQARPPPRSRGPAPRPLRAPGDPADALRTDSDSRAQVLEARYLEARKSLRLWPVVGDDVMDGVRTFLVEKLLCPPNLICLDGCTARRVASTDAAKDQVVVVFNSIAMRDEIKSLGKNLKGNDRAVGMQMEPPDHLRGQYQSFQKLAYHLKKKHPGLRRNVKFLDTDMCLTMDVCLTPTSGWKTVEYVDAKSILGKARVRTESFSLQELEDLVEVPRKRRRETLRDTDSDDDMNDETVIDLTDAHESDVTNNTEKKSCPPSLSFINTNSRSLGNKLQSLADCFDEKGLNVASITETWFQSDRTLPEIMSDLEGEHGLVMLTRNRSIRAINGRQYGGVAFVYRKNNASFKTFALHNPEDYEVLVCVGKVHGNKGKLAVITCYAPPNLTAIQAQSMADFLSDVVGELKRKYPDIAIILSGDFNQWSIAEIICDHPDLSEVDYGPTRGDRAIDRTLINFARSLTESYTLPPLETEDGRPSDHKIAYARAVFPRADKKLISYSYREFTEAGGNNFVTAVSAQDWSEVYSQETSTDKVRVFQAILDKHMNENFKLKTTTRRETDPPWINDNVRRLWRKRRKVYDREGRSKLWRKLKNRSDKLIEKRAERYMQKQKQILTAPDATRSFYKNVKAYKSKEKPATFDVRDLYNGKGDSEVAEALADHFSAISNEFNGLDDNLELAASNFTLPVLPPTTIRSRLCKFRKPKSMVRGDIFPVLVNRVAASLSLPLSNIYNHITATGTWPELWKVEYVTPIPKATMPAGPDDLRNISCTQLFSKVYESFVLDWLGTQVKLRSNQFGGVKGSGSEHSLLKLWQGVLEAIEDPRAGALLTSIDYAKAFNRLDFNHCLRSLRAKGACHEILKIIASFLTNRQMTVKVGNEFSVPRTVLGGVPQGSLLGVMLFNLSIDTFEAYSPDVANYGNDTLERVEDLPNGERVPPEPTQRDYRHLTPWETELLEVIKYVDDNVILEKCNFDTVLTNQYSVRDKHAIRTQNLFARIVTLAERCGMKVNYAKTKAMVISEIKGYLPSAHFYDNQGSRVDSSDEMKILGFHFSSSPDMSAQVTAIKKKFRARIWILRHLGHRGFSKEDLLKVYRSVILPVHDYCSCVYNSTLTITQASALERLQAQALKSIYGYELSYSSLLEVSGLEKLQARRDNRCRKFASKCLENDRFREWFPLNTIARPTRGRLNYVETFARTKRLYNSPIFHMRRLLNGKDY